MTEQKPPMAAIDKFWWGIVVALFAGTGLVLMGAFSSDRAASQSPVSSQQAKPVTDTYVRTMPKDMHGLFQSVVESRGFPCVEVQKVRIYEGANGNSTFRLQCEQGGRDYRIERTAPDTYTVSHWKK